MKSPRSTAYHKLPIEQKQAEALSRVRESSVSCPRCDTQVMPADLLSHLETRCPGPREPGPGARWLTGREVRELGVNQTTLSFWARTGQVRSVGERMDRRYLQRDLVLKIAQRWGFRRR